MLGLTSTLLSLLLLFQSLLLLLLQQPHAKQCCKHQSNRRCAPLSALVSPQVWLGFCTGSMTQR
jgi:hypothetical protein